MTLVKDVKAGLYSGASQSAWGPAQWHLQWLRAIGLSSESGAGRWEFITKEKDGRVRGWKTTRRKHQGLIEVLAKAT